jgi:4-carboxymuconolactone decarboxylase
MTTQQGRLNPVAREDLSPTDQATWDAIAASHRGGVRGPFAALIHAPELAGRVSHLEDYFRGGGMGLPDGDRELVILATVREAAARFGWVVHERRAREVGTRHEAIEVLRSMGETDGLAPREKLLVDLSRTLSRARHIPDELYALAVKELGEKTLLETVVLVGHYCMIGLVINGFEVPAESDPGF